MEGLRDLLGFLSVPGAILLLCLAPFYTIIFVGLAIWLRSLPFLVFVELVGFAWVVYRCHLENKHEEAKERRWQQELRKEAERRERQERLQRKITEDAKTQFEESVMRGSFPSEQVLEILAGCDSDIPVNPKEALEELLYGSCSFRTMTFGDAVRRIQQRRRIEERAKVKTARRDAGNSEPTGPVTQTEAYGLLGAKPGCTPEELASAYHRKVSEWHPDKLETMADELKAYATRRTARINEGYQLLRQRA